MLMRLRLLLPAVFILPLVACEKETTLPTEEVVRPAKIFTVLSPGATYLKTFPGEVSASNEAELAFRVSGKLVELPAIRGMRVKQGDLLARLDPADYQAELDRTVANNQLAKVQYERYKELEKKKLVSKSEYDTRWAEYKVTQSALQRAQNNLDYTRIYAPFDGVVARRMISNFETIIAGQLMMVIQTGEMIDVIVDAPESIVARAQRNAAHRKTKPVFVIFDSISNKEYKAYYKEHETQANPATLTYKVTFSLPMPPDINVLPGMTASIVMDLGTLFGGDSKGYLVPIESVFAAENKPVDSQTRYVWKLDPATMRAQQAAVTVGPLTGDSIVVLSGLTSEDMIIAAGVNAVHENMPVRHLTREAGL